MSTTKVHKLSHLQPQLPVNAADSADTLPLNHLLTPRQNGSTDYATKLKSPLWQRRRLEIMQRDSFKCKRCGNDHLELQIHHKDYWPGRRPWEYPDGDLITLCVRCHKEELNRTRTEKMLLQSLKDRGFLAGDLLALSTMLYFKNSFAGELLTQIRKFSQR